MTDNASNLMSYAGKKVVLTGGASGMGAAAVELLVAAGCTDLTVIDVQAPPQQAGDFIKADLSDPDEIDAVCDAIGDGIDVLFNNAGVAGTQPPEYVMRVNYLAPRRLTEKLLGAMNSGGSIVNTASIAGNRWMNNHAAITELIALNTWDEALEWIAQHDELVAPTPYEFSKEVMQVWTMHVSKRSFTDHQVRTNSVCPGVVDTPLLYDFREHMHQQAIDWIIGESGGLISPDEIARTMLMLGSDASIAMNGHNMIVDRGFTGWFATGQLDLSNLS